MIDKEERNLWVGNNRFFLDEDNIIHAIIVGDFDVEIASKFGESVLKLMEMTEDKVDIIIDLNNSGKPSSEARKIGAEMFENEKIRKISMVGVHPVARVLASFMIGITNKKDIRFFKTKEEALEWLKD